MAITQNDIDAIRSIVIKQDIAALIKWLRAKLQKGSFDLLLLPSRLIKWKEEGQWWSDNLGTGKFEKAQRKFLFKWGYHLLSIPLSEPEGILGAHKENVLHIYLFC